jgi:hypothetical protein
VFKYAYPGPPFNWLGTFAASQKNAFETWVNARTTNFAPIQTWYQIRAQQFRKAAGLLENYNQNYTEDQLKPTFNKPSWQPGPQGHWVGNPRNDQFPMIAVSTIKGYMQPQFEYDDEAMFFMNHLRTLIERNEDEAQYANGAAAAVKVNISNIESYFTQPQYQAVLVDDVNSSNMYNGQPFFRVNPLDAPTQFELEQHGRVAPGAPVNLKYVDTQPGQ